MEMGRYPWLLRQSGGFEGSGPFLLVHEASSTGSSAFGMGRTEAEKSQVLLFGLEGLAWKGPRRRERYRESLVRPAGA
jgi:hypothetical protein